jgi:hypothetical protein
MTTNSVYNPSSRYVHGGVTEVGSVGLEWWERRKLVVDPTDYVFTVDYFHAGRLDLIATLFFGEPRYWWVIGQINNILDPLAEVVAGRVLYIPNQDRLFLILTGKQGGINSERQKDIRIISPIIL